MIKNLNERDVYNDLISGLSIRNIMKKYQVSKDFVYKVKNQGKLYTNLNTGEIVFSSKKISQKEQLFHMLSLFDDNGMPYLEKQDNYLIRRRRPNPRLSYYLDVAPSQTTRWSKKEKRLVECDEYGRITKEYCDLAQEFLATEESKYIEGYYLDENEMVKGYKLWYATISEGWSDILRQYVELYEECFSIPIFISQAKKTFTEDKLLYLNTRVSMKLSQYMSLNGIKSFPKYLYIETSAYEKGLVPEEYKHIVERYSTLKPKYSVGDDDE